MQPTYWAGIFLVIATVISIVIYFLKTDQAHIPCLSKWFIVAFVSFSLFCFVISPFGRTPLTQELCRAVVIANIFAFLFAGIALMELIFNLVEKLKRKI
ncbi:MAG: hypothetical protein PHW50_00025 [Patescibacteria group bacterium]|nr:hypothetical protein [Patescibacteria group bacterium]